MPNQNYLLKIIILFIATFSGIFAIWFALIREDSANWITSQVVHQVSPYAITETDDSLIINNVVMGYGFSLPVGFISSGAKNLSFFMQNGDEKICEIRHYYSNDGPANFLEPEEGNLVIPLGRQKLVFEVVNQAEKNVCGKYLAGIKNNLVVE